jgi:D-2-hydroxyacid dehydrogenase (NADP+)
VTGLQIILEQRYATKKNLDRVVQLSPDARIAVFHIRERYPMVRIVRGAFRRTLPWFLYDPISIKLDPIAEAQRLEWVQPPTSSSDITNVLLYPPMVEWATGKGLLDLLSPRWVHSVMTGVDRIPYLPAEVLLTNSRGIHSLRIAEFTIGLIFALAKNIPQHTVQTRSRIWKPLPSEMIQGSRLGIVGLGSIGKEVARLSKAAGMEVWAIKREVTQVDFVDHVLPPKELPRFLSEVDYVVLAVPLNKETRNLIGKEEFKLMKPTACLINISRGRIVDETSLYQALKNSNIRAACLDVFQDENPLPRNSLFYKLPNLLITSFSAYYSRDSINQVMDLFFENLKRFVVGEPLLNLVHPATYSLYKQTGEKGNRDARNKCDYSNI